MIALHDAPPPRSRFWRGRRRALLAAAYSALLLSCDNPLAPTEETVGRVEVNPSVLSLVQGDTRPVSATVISEAGQPLRDRRTFWSTANPAIATVSQAGIVTAIAPGATQVAASAGGKSALVAVTVSERPVVQVRVTPSPANVQVGRTVTLTAQALDAVNAQISGRPVIWATSSATTATVSSTGVVTGVAAGTATISATIDNVVGNAVVTVQPVPVASVRVTPATGGVVAGETLQLTAAPLDADGNALSGRVITWGSSSQSIASVSSTGLVTAISAGQVTITATCEGRSSTSELSVSPVPVDTVSVSPSSATVASGQAVQLSARLADSKGNLLTGRAITWTSDQPSIATVSATGNVTGVGTGAARITASSEGKTGTSLVTVTPVPLASIAITPPGGSLVTGTTLQLTGEARDAQGRALPGRVITWITGAPSIASVSRTGLVTALAPGSAVVFAASEGVSASVTITVSNIGVARVNVTPNNAAVSVGGQLQLNAVALDAQGATLAGKIPVWGSSDDLVATVSSTGRVTGIAPGVITITATVDGVSGTATVSVANAPVASVFLSPINVSVFPGTTQPYVVTLLDGQGRSLSSTGKLITWNSTNTAVATINSAGVATAIAPGTTNITATVDGVTGTTPLTVAVAQVATLTLIPATSTITVGGTVSLVPLLADAQGNPLSTSGRTITWSALDPTIATVDAAGLVTGVAVGSNARIVASTPSSGGARADTSLISVTNVPVARVVIASGATSDSVYVGPAFQKTYTAQAFDASNNLLTGRAFTWTSTNQSVAQIGGSTGTVTGISPASTSIIAVAEGKADTLRVDVGFVPITSVDVALFPAGQVDSALIGVARTYRATPKYNGAAIGTIELGGRVATWSIVPGTGAATVVPVGGSPNDATATGTTAGTVNVQASFGTPTSTGTTASPLKVLTPVTQVLLTTLPVDSLLSAGTTSIVAIAADAGGNVVPGRAITLTSSSNVLTLPGGTLNGVSQTGTISATLTAGTPATGRGTASLSASVPYDGRSLPTPRTVIVLTPITSIAVTAPDSMLAGATATATALLKDAAGNTITNRLVAWGSSNPAALTVNATTGALSGITAGSAQVSVTLSPFDNNQTSQKNVDVLERVNAATFAVARTGIRVGEILPTTKTLTGTAGTDLTPSRSVTYTSSAPSVITVSAAGVVTAVGPGTADVTMTTVLEGFAAPKLTFTVTPPPVTSVAVTANDSSIFTAQTVTATAVATDSVNNTTSLVGRTVTWASSNTSVATVQNTSNASNTITAGSTPGTSTISVTVDGIAASFPLSVSLVPVDSIAISPNSWPSPITGDAQQFTVQLFDAARNPLSATGRNISWTTSQGASAPNPKVSLSATSGGTITVTALDSGTVTLTATSVAETKSRSVTFSIQLPTIQNIDWNTLTSTVAAGNTTTLTVTVSRLVSGAPAPLAGRACTIQSSQTSVATVSPANALTDALGRIQVTVQVLPTATSGSTTDITASCEGFTSQKSIVTVQ